MRFFFQVFMLILLASCNGKQVSTPATGLRVSDPDHLYFKNVRVNQYASVDDHELHLTKFVHRKFREDNAMPLQLTLVDNWIHNLAFLELTGLPTIDENKGAFFRMEGTGNVQVLTVTQLNDRPSLEQFGREIGGNARICYLENGASPEHCFAVGSPVRLALRETITDFLRLTRLEE